MAAVRIEGEHPHAGSWGVDVEPSEAEGFVKDFIARAKSEPGDSPESMQRIAHALAVARAVAERLAQGLIADVDQARNEVM